VLNFIHVQNTILLRRVKSTQLVMAIVIPLLFQGMQRNLQGNKSDIVRIQTTRTSRTKLGLYSKTLREFDQLADIAHGK
jgi:hypothetical protein